MILIDSSVWIDHFRAIDTPHTRRLQEIIAAEELLLGDLVLTEVLQGFERDRMFRLALEIFDPLPVIEIGGRDAAIQAANHFRQLRTLGITVRKTIDTLIATRCIMDGYSLLHSDRDFDPFVEHLGLKSAMA